MPNYITTNISKSSKQQQGTRAKLDISKHQFDLQRRWVMCVVDLLLP